MHVMVGLVSSGMEKRLEEAYELLFTVLLMFVQVCEECVWEWLALTLPDTGWSPDASCSEVGRELKPAVQVGWEGLPAVRLGSVQLMGYLCLCGCSPRGNCWHCSHSGMVCVVSCYALCDMVQISVTQGASTSALVIASFCPHPSQDMFQDTQFL